MAKVVKNVNIFNFAIKSIFMFEMNPLGWDEYKLIDSGDFEKLEKYGKYILRRPEPQAIWPKSLTEKEWKERADGWFKRTGKDNSDNNERGTWICSPSLPERWRISYRCEDASLSFRLAMTSFKHVGLFPEQADNWKFIYKKVSSLKEKDPSVLNLFAYTGGSSLAAAAAGANVTHVDSVKQVVNWARENQEHSRVSNIRWIVDDALKFVQREVRRGNKYNGIILDPPAYGRGPSGEKWILKNQLPVLLEECSRLLKINDSFVVLNLYSMGFSPIIASNLLKLYFHRKDVEYGELTINDESGKVLPLSVFARF